MKLHEIPTPAFVIDRARLVRNLDRMRSKAARSSVVFRPHVKTHKSPEIAKLGFGGNTGPITVSTLAEAERFADAGFDDITYAFPIAIDKLERAASLARRIRLHLLFDHRDALDAATAFARANDVRLSMWLKVDCGYHRAGVDPDDPESLRLAFDAAAAAEIEFRGFLTHAGHSYHARSTEEIRSIAQQETSVLNLFREKFEQGGGPRLPISVGSTPTCSLVERFDGCDGVRPGNYVFYDWFQSRVGSCSVDDIAALVLTEVVGVYPQQKKILVNAGALALSKDLGATHLGDSGYGAVLTLDREVLPMEIHSISQEHGQIRGMVAERFRVGQRLFIAPNHSCLTAAMYDRYYLLDGDRVAGELTPARGW